MSLFHSCLEPPPSPAAAGAARVPVPIIAVTNAGEKVPGKGRD